MANEVSKINMKRIEAGFTILDILFQMDTHPSYTNTHVQSFKLSFKSIYDWNIQTTRENWFINGINEKLYLGREINFEG